LGGGMLRIQGAEHGRTVIELAAPTNDDDCLHAACCNRYAAWRASRIS
jgi:hypothetical protein